MKRTIFGLTAALLFTAARARADGIAVERLGEGDRESVELGGVLAVVPRNGEVNAAHVQPSLAAALRLSARWSMTLDAAFGFTSFRAVDRERRTSSRFANPLLGAHLQLFGDERRALRFGFALGPPLVTAPGGLDQNSAAAFADRMALEARGTQAPWLWANNAVPLVFVAVWRERLSEHWHLRFDAQPGYLVSVNRRSSRAALDATVTSEHPFGHWAPAALLHAYTQSVPILDRDFAQFSAGLAARYDARRFWLRGEWDVNLDGPGGFGHRNRTPWGVTLAAGARF